MRVDVQVVDGSRPVSDLKKEDFQLYDEGQPRAIAYFGQEDVPLSLLLLLDISGSMSRYLDQLIHSSTAALKFLRPEDEVGVMLFSRRTAVLQEFTPDRRFVARALQEADRGQNLGSGTVINPSLLEAAELMRKQVNPARRKAILILTDNAALNYKSPDEQVVQALLESGTVLDAIVPGRYGRPKPPKAGVALNPDFTPADVFKIAEATGGQAVRDERVERSFPEMIERIRRRYSLQYTPPQAASGSFRHVRVELTAAARQRHPKAMVQAREGYYAR